MLCGTRWAEPLRLSEWERSVAELGLTRGVASGNAGEGFVANVRKSLGDEREAMERGQEMERLIGPERSGAGLGLRGLIGGFQFTRPAEIGRRGK